jgi:hypothetical protein
MSDSDPTKSCYSCGNSISIYADSCGNCSAAHDPAPPAATSVVKNPKSPVVDSGGPKGLDMAKIPGPVNRPERPKQPLYFENTVDQLTQSQSPRRLVRRFGLRRSTFWLVLPRPGPQLARHVVGVKARLTTSKASIRPGRYGPA